MERILLLAVLALAAAGCARDLDSEQAFQAYVSELKLEALSVSAAAERLQAEGFACTQTRGSSEGFAITCERGTGGFPCGRRLFVGLGFPAGAGTASTVTARFGVVCP